MKAKVGHASCSFFICSKCDKNDSPAWSWAVGRAHQLSSHPVKNKGRKRWKKQKHGITMNNTSTGHPQDEVAMASLVSTIIYMYHQLSSIIITYLIVSLCHLVHEADHGSSGAIWTGDSDASTAGQQRFVHGLRHGASGSAHSSRSAQKARLGRTQLHLVGIGLRQAQGKLKASSNMLVAWKHLKTRL